MSKYNSTQKYDVSIFIEICFMQQYTQLPQKESHTENMLFACVHVCSRAKLQIQPPTGIFPRIHDCFPSALLDHYKLEQNMV